MIRGRISQFLIHGISWIIGFVFAYIVMSHSHAKEVYGVIVGWWCASYFGYVFNVELKVAASLFMTYVLICLTSAICGSTWFYHDINGSIDLDLLIALSLQGIFFISPLVFNFLVKKIKTSF